MAETITVHALFGKAVLQEISIDQLHSGKYQPRDNFSEEGILSLARTIEQLGVRTHHCSAIHAISRPI